MSLSATCQGCRRKILVERVEGGHWKKVGPCGCDETPLQSPAPAAAAPRLAALPRPSRGGFSAAVRTGCSCGRSHPSRMQARVCLTLRAEVEPAGGWVLHEVALPLPLLGPQPRSKKRKTKPLPPGRAFTIRVDFVAAWPDGRWKAVEAKNPSMVHRDWKARAGALRTWYGRDPLFGGLEERTR